MSRLSTLASRLRPCRERDATPGASGPRTARARAWAGLYVGIVEGRDDEDE